MIFAVLFVHYLLFGALHCCSLSPKIQNRFAAAGTHYLDGTHDGDFTVPYGSFLFLGHRPRDHGPDIVRNPMLSIYYSLRFF